MNDGVTAQALPAIHALPDGEAEISLVVRLPWEDVARLGQEAGRLAAQLKRPVTLDEAVGNRLRTVRPSAAHARPAGEQPAATTTTATTASVASLPRITGTA
ncbi:hypothetical protein [Streptomyces sp. NPDC002265]|uniref:hypothetical protein n=1 Tax=Streptomyces sp. NPDC002265 TaxID=3154415 RepID=UPI00332862AB